MSITMMMRILQVLSYLGLLTGGINSVCCNSLTGCVSFDEDTGTEISRTFFQNCEDPEIIDLRGQGIRTIQNGTFQGFSNLEKLHLNDNMLDLLYTETFCGAPNLTEIDLNENKLYGIRTETFRCVRKLQTLLLDKNDIEFLSDGSFANLENLETLKLSSNKLTDRSFPLGIFKDLVSLVSLDLSHNFLRVISMTFFEGLDSLERLHLTDNILTSVNMLYFWKNNLQIVELENNPKLDRITISPGQIQIKKLNHFSALYKQCNCTNQTSSYTILVENKQVQPSCGTLCKTSTKSNEYSSQTREECSSAIYHNGWNNRCTFSAVFVAFLSCIMFVDNYCNG